MAYNPDYVMAMMLKFANAGELEQAFRQMQWEPMGFVRHQG